ncbi:unnamed protein product [Angiostrongylus costaricensis]|uniref:Integrin_alpha2 domain-containing protein n=1 Tax=Angiostrongylus costaricensis TaxID=334426 RepID=A0A0R3PBU2_ANGCS|nr:unnamed protein product [Angiostrongylus costaricensis]
MMSDVIGLAETRKRRTLNAVYESEEELFLGTGDNRVGDVAVLVNTSLDTSNDSFELTVRIRRLQFKKCESTPALTPFVIYAPKSSYDEDEDSYMDPELHMEDRTFFKAKIGPK